MAPFAAHFQSRRDFVARTQSDCRLLFFFSKVQREEGRNSHMHGTAMPLAHARYCISSLLLELYEHEKPKFARVPK